MRAACFSYVCAKTGWNCAALHRKAKTPTSCYRVKKEMLTQIYRILALNLSEPPVEFTWTRRDSDGMAVDTKTYTPQSFYKTYFGNDLKNDYVMLMNDPTTSTTNSMK